MSYPIYFSAIKKKGQALLEKSGSSCECRPLSFENCQLPAQVLVLPQPRRYIPTPSVTLVIRPTTTTGGSFTRLARRLRRLFRKHEEKIREKKDYPAECRNARIGKRYLALSTCLPAVAYSRLDERNKCNVVTVDVGNGVIVTAGHPYIDKLLETTVTLIAKGGLFLTPKVLSLFLLHSLFSFFLCQTSLTFEWLN